MHLIFEILPQPPSSHVAARIAWENDGRAYPDATWVDNAEILLGWWLGSLIRYSEGSDHEKLTFMEGPYSLQLRHSREKGKVLLRSQDARVEWETDFADLTAGVLRASEQLREFARTAPSPINIEGFMRAESTLRSTVSDSGT